MGESVGLRGVSGGFGGALTPLPRREPPGAGAAALHHPHLAALRPPHPPRRWAPQKLREHPKTVQTPQNSRMTPQIPHRDPLQNAGTPLQPLPGTHKNPPGKPQNHGTPQKPRGDTPERLLGYPSTAGPPPVPQEPPKPREPPKSWGQSQTVNPPPKSGRDTPETPPAPKIPPRVPPVFPAGSSGSVPPPCALLPRAAGGAPGPPRAPQRQHGWSSPEAGGRWDWGCWGDWEHWGHWGHWRVLGALGGVRGILEWGTVG